MPDQLNYLGAARISRIINALQDPRLLPQELVWSRRIPRVNAMDEEITARFTGTVKVADLIADDAKAVTYSMGRFSYEVNRIPNIKVGVAMNQAALNKMSDLARYYPGGIPTVPAGDPGLNMFNNWEKRALDTVDLGVKQRIEQLTVAMLCDGVGFTYDRLGIKLTGATWGMYADLKATAGTAWDTAGSATPVNDLLSLKLIGKVRYGVDFDRVTMSTQAFRYMIATTEFQAKAKLYVPAQLAGSAYSSFLNLQNLQQQQAFAANVLGMTIELYDARYWQQDSNGVDTSVPFLPITNVILTDSRADGSGNSYDFANGMPTESIVANAAPVNVIGGTIPQQFGPISYATAADSNLNPPGIVYWGVARGFPRKHRQQASAVISVGAFSDSISTAIPAVI